MALHSLHRSDDTYSPYGAGSSDSETSNEIGEDEPAETNEAVSNSKEAVDAEDDVPSETDASEASNSEDDDSFVEDPSPAEEEEVPILESPEVPNPATSADDADPPQTDAAASKNGIPKGTSITSITSTSHGAQPAAAVLKNIRKPAVRKPQYTYGKNGYPKGFEPPPKAERDVVVVGNGGSLIDSHMGKIIDR
jgi:hypothetical protein